MDNITIDYSILNKYSLCHRCFGRLYAKSLRTTNYERGRALKMAKAIELELNLANLYNLLNGLNELNENSNDAEEIKEIEIKKEELTLKINNIKEELKNIYKSGLIEITNMVENIEEIKETEETTNENEKKYSCPYCRDIFDKNHLNDISEKILKFTGPYEFDTFLIGTVLPKKIKELEKEIINDNPMAESIKQEFNRMMGKIIVEKTNKMVEKTNPDIVIMVNPYNKRVELQINSIFIKGRYNKLIRGIPQSHWHCRSCRGKGCEKCDWTGKQYPTSVEEIIAEPFMKVFKGKEEAFHGAGREDIDVRMLGNGRPFVLQIKEPKIRKADLKPLMEEVNKSGKVEIHNLEYGVRKDVIFFKNEAHRKTYLALVECEEEITEKEIEQLVEKLKNLTINQRTPQRVSHRRADLVRIRNVYDVSANILNKNEFELKIYCDGGLYIKELIHGDEGRTLPSVSELLNKKCICKFLDVWDVHDSENEEGQ
jgi:tRNA pseudouridine synthase 10